MSLESVSQLALLLVRVCLDIHGLALLCLCGHLLPGVLEQSQLGQLVSAPCGLSSSNRLA